MKSSVCLSSSTALKTVRQKYVHDTPVTEQLLVCIVCEVSSLAKRYLCVLLTIDVRICVAKWETFPLLNESFLNETIH